MSEFRIKKTAGYRLPTIPKPQPKFVDAVTVISYSEFVAPVVEEVVEVKIVEEPKIEVKVEEPVKEVKLEEEVKVEEVKEVVVVEEKEKPKKKTKKSKVVNELTIRTIEPETNVKIE